MSRKKVISIVCPVLNEEASVRLFYDRLQKALVSLRGRYDFELIFTNNGSTDGTLEAILNLRREDPTVQVLTMSRNFGYQATVGAGLRNASGEAIAVIDVDCEDPPEMIPTFVEEWERGYDVVYGKRDKRSEAFAMQLLRKAFYRFNRLVADSEIILDMAEFFLISASVRDAILNNASTFPFLRTEVAYVGFQRKAIPYARQRRVRGVSHYNLLRATKFAIGGILSSSTLPLRLSAYLYLPLAGLNLLALAGAWRQGVATWFQTLLVLDFLYVSLFVGIIAIYLARTYKDVVGRPLYVIDWQKSYLNGRGGLGRLFVPGREGPRSS